VQTGDGKNILIDSGLPAHLQIPEGRPAPVMGPNVLEQLAQLGLQPGDIDTLICTHFDLDHCGHNEDFPNATLVAQRTLYEAARAGLERFERARAHWDLPAQRYRLVDGDTTLLPGLELIETSGHVPGHQAVLVRLPATGPVLLTIDAVSVQGNFRADRQGGPMDLNGEQAIASTGKLLALAEREHVALTIFGHDGPQWSSLKKLPDYYE
jgi:N-acyl homoserine lactone hydrolase